MKDLSTRVITALIFAVLFLFCVIYSWWSLVFIFGLFSMIGLSEYRQIVDKITPIQEDSYDMALFWVNGLCVYLITCWVGTGHLSWNYSFITLVIIIIPMVIKSWFLPDYSWKEALAYAWGYIWIVIPMGMATYFSFYRGDFDPRLIIYLLIIIWIHDIMAYFIGRRFGRTKMMPSISPKKTIEGFLGGVLGAILMSLIIGQFDSTFSLRNWLSIGLVVSIFASSGDLFESWLKRMAGIKDSGRILPGHGGVLDRFDAFLFCVPPVLLVILLFFR